MDLEGKNYCGLTIDWNYDKEYVDISIPIYNPKYINVFSILPPKIHNMNPTNGQFQHMAKSLSMQKYQTTPHLLIKKAPDTHKIRLGH